jgi:hypothetical protein
VNSIRSPETRCQFSITRMLPSLETRPMISRTLVRASAVGNVNVVDAVALDIRSARSRGHEVDGGIERTTTDGALSDEGEEAFDLVEPRGIGGREVNVPARTACEPSSDLGILVGGAIIDDKMDVGLVQRSAGRPRAAVLSACGAWAKDRRPGRRLRIRSSCPPRCRPRR